jgi:hypothetical protein
MHTPPEWRNHRRVEYNISNVGTSGEWMAQRAAIFSSSVGLKHHVGVHRQLSISVHVNLRAGLGRLTSNNTMPRCYRSTHVIYMKRESS